MNDITVQHIVEIHRLNQGLAQFVREGLRAADHKVGATIDLLMGCLAQKSMDQLDGHSRMSGAAVQRSKRVELVQASPAEQAYSAYANFVSSHFLAAIAQHRPAEVGELPRIIQETIVAATGRLYLESVSIDAAGDEVSRAWQQARRNGQLAFQRLGALGYLASQTPSHLQSLGYGALNAEVTAARSALLEAANGYETSEMKFAILMGGSALEVTRQKMVAKSFGEGMGIMHYLQENESLPGRSSTSTEQRFREKITEYSHAA